jgi:hypothetical protein
MNIYKLAQEIAKEALKDRDNDFYAARDYLHEYCENFDFVIYYDKAIRFCAEQNTSDGEQWLEDCGGIAQDGDTFGTIASRIAYATIYAAAEDALHEMESEVAA